MPLSVGFYWNGWQILVCVFVFWVVINIYCFKVQVLGKLILQPTLFLCLVWCCQWTVVKSCCVCSTVITCNCNLFALINLYFNNLQPIVANCAIQLKLNVTSNIASNYRECFIWYVCTGKCCQVLPWRSVAWNLQYTIARWLVVAIECYLNLVYAFWCSQIDTNIISCLLTSTTPEEVVVAVINYICHSIILILRYVCFSIHRC